MFKQQHKLSIFTICGKWVFRLDQSSVLSLSWTKLEKNLFFKKEGKIYEIKHCASIGLQDAAADPTLQNPI